MTLEQQLFALFANHNLTSLTLHVGRIGDGDPYLYASAQGGNECAFDEQADKTSASSVLASAIGQLEVKRRPPVADVPALTPMVTA